ncbi:UNVERIFIED_CONTAM: hypothetical protein HDU68_008221 [Siphonaria sp. JEL0065]|nr:hypothetical protein HDU68_008221 [Siphonaria sp. JEL0065]
MTSQSSQQEVGSFAMDSTWNDIGGELELDAVNGNICMKGILSVINRLPVADKDTDMPVWMKSLLAKIEKQDSHINIRLFIAKIVINLPSVFAPFAKFWWKAVAKLIQDADLFGNGINYFVQDLCLLLMEWTKNANQFTLHSDRDLILKTLRWLVRHCNHESKATIRNHLRIIRVLIENWKTYVTAPTDVIFDLLHAKVDSNIKSEKYLNLTGIYVLQSFVANEVSPYNASGLTDRIFSEAEMFDLLCGLLVSSKYKEVFSPLAECVGDVLSYLEKTDSGLRGTFSSKIEDACRRRFTTDTKSYVIIVNRISVNYPRILETQYKCLLNTFPKLDLDLKGKTLEALLSFADEIPDLFTEIVGLDLEDILSSQDEECQTFTLGILGILAPTLTATQITKFLPISVDIFLLHSSDRCRAAFFSLIHKLNESTAVSNDDILNRLVKFALLKGLADSDEGIRSSLLEFFNTKVFGSRSVYDRVLDLVSQWYVPEVEEAFLKYGVHFLLEATKLTPQFEEAVFPAGLPDARFNDRDIVVDLVWERSSSMLPLFAATQDRPSFSLDDSGGAVRMTQDMVWTPTLDVNAKAARNLFSRAVSEFENKSQSLSTQPGIERRAIIRRSYASKKDSTFFAYDAERKKKETKDIEKFKKSASQRNVSLFRKYREGELPDIEIKHKEVIGPLQSLAARDNDISRQLFSLLTSQMTLDDPRKRIDPELLGRAFNGIFKTSSILSSPFIGSILEAMLNNTELIQHTNPALISHVASGSSNFELGALVIEKGIDAGLFTSPEAKRSKNANRLLKKSPEGWVPLASLFKDLKQVEVYQSIYESHIASSVITKEAITAELLGDFESAKTKYLEGLTGESMEANDAEPALWSIQRLECMNKLGEWRELGSSLLQDVDDNVNRLWEDDKIDPYLKLFLRSHLKLKTMSSENSESEETVVKKLLEDCKKDVKKRQILEQYFTSDLMVNAFDSNDLNLTRHYVDLSWKRFIASFAELNTSATTSRIDMLASLQPICEYDEFLTFAKVAKAGGVTKADINSLFSGWRSRFPAATDSISIWDDVISSRKLMISKTSEMFNGLLISNTEDLVTEFHETVVSDDLLYSRQMAKAASKQNLFTVASRWLGTANSNSGEFEPEFMQQYYKFLLLQSDHEFGSMNKFKLLENVIKHMDYYRKSIRATSTIFQLKFLTLEVRALSRLLSLAYDLSSNDSFFGGLASSKTMTRFTGQKVESKQDLLQFFLTRSKHNIRLLYGLEIPVHNLQKGLIEIGMFVDKTLRSLENDKDLGNAMGLQPESAKLIVNSIFRAMVIGSSKAIEIFPRLLQLLNEYPDLREEFEAQSKECPTWMFLRWLPQLTSLLDKPSWLSVLPLVLQIAKLYPNALRFPFSISCEQYRFTPETSKNAKLVDNIKYLLRSEAYDKLALELRRLEDPTHIFKDLLDRFQSLISSSLPTKRTAIKEAFEEFKAVCLDTKKSGNLIKKFAEKHTSKISSICGVNGEKLDEKKLKELEGYRVQFGTEAESKAGKNLLKSFSVWLDEYQIANLDASLYLEVPGQYTGESEPKPAEHVYISNFDPSVLVMSSMRRPKKVVMIGSDGKEYPWLVKGGEDLRLDQRIEQMFAIMNEMVLKNQYCVRNRIAVATYKVIPMSTSLGILEWVDNTKPLKACMENSKSFQKKFEESRTIFGDFVGKHGKGGYDAFLQTASTKSVVDNMTSLWNKNRESYLREFFVKLTVSPEAFFQVRSEFANSLAALNTCSYLLGIGDRHLDNFLVDLKSGRIIGIDFGHAFGSATEVLPVPELVPFRLSNQMEKFLLPLGVQSLIVHPMTNVLSAIQDDKERLLNSLNIFVNEPLIEWRKFAVIQMRKQGKNSMSMGSAPDSIAAPDWYPQQKLEIAKRKLDGENPAFITADELAIGHDKRKFYKNMRAVLMGDPALNVRAKTGKMCQTPREQVDCLVDLAMDPNVLGRAWIGWSPFM